MTLFKTPVNYMNATSESSQLFYLVNSYCCQRLSARVPSYRPAVEPLPCTHRQGQLKLLPHMRTLQLSLVLADNKEIKTRLKGRRAALQTDGAWAMTRSTNITAGVRGEGAREDASLSSS